MQKREHHSIVHHNPEPGKRYDGKKLSIDHCQEVLKRNGLIFSDKEVEGIRDFLYLLAEIEYEYYKSNDHEEESDSLHPRLD